MTSILGFYTIAASRQNLFSGFPTRFDTNLAVQPQKMAILRNSGLEGRGIVSSM